MRISFVYPSIETSGWNAGYMTMDNAMIHLGLCYLSASLKEKGHKVNLIDLRRLRGWEDYKLTLKEQNPDFLCITCRSPDYDFAIEAARLAKEEENGRIKTVIGGVHPTVMPSECDLPFIDYILKGEGEITLPELIKNPDKFDKVVEGEHPDLNAIPFPDRWLFNFDEAVKHPLLDGFEAPWIEVITSRGCIYNCNFCQPAERMVFGKKVRKRSVENVMAELDMLYERYKFKTLMIHDDCFTEFPNWVLRFCEEYKKRGYSDWFCQTRADLVCKHKDLIKEMADSGCKLMIIGFESGSQRVLDFLKKGVTIEQNLEAAEICRRCDIEIWANFMFGVPTETNEEVMETIEHVKKIRPDHFSPAFFVPYPGSELYDYCLKNGLMAIKEHCDYTRYPSGKKIERVDYNFIANALHNIY